MMKRTKEFKKTEFHNSYIFTKNVLMEWNCKKEKIEDVLSILEEEITNLEKYSEASFIHVDLELIEDTLYLTVSDDGIPFNPYFIKEEEQNGGMGILLLKKRADYYSYEYKDSKNFNYIRKKIL